MPAPICPLPPPHHRRRIATILVAGLFAALLTARHPLTQLGAAVLAGGATGYALAARRHTTRMCAALAAARRDPLTGLPTRAVAEHLLGHATATAMPLTVALADVDGLHAVNANFGHAAGDQYLSAVAQRLARAVPEGGTLIRQGGDEFLLVAPHTAPDTLAARIGAALAGPAVIAGYRIQPRASVGIADSTGGDAHRALARSDAAMYSAKHAGGNAILTYSRRRDGEPAADGTRPALRRRDLDPGEDGAARWSPPAGDQLIALLVSAAELQLLHDELRPRRPGAPPDPGGDEPARSFPGGTRTRLAARLDELLAAQPAAGPARGDAQL